MRTHGVFSWVSQCYSTAQYRGETIRSIDVYLNHHVKSTPKPECTNIIVLYVALVWFLGKI